MGQPRAAGHWALLPASLKCAALCPCQLSSLCNTLRTAVPDPVLSTPFQKINLCTFYKILASAQSQEHCRRFHSMITHESTRAIRGNCVLPWPCDLAAACSQHSIPRPDTSAFPRGKAAKSSAAVDLKDIGHTDRLVLWGAAGTAGFGPYGDTMSSTPGLGQS